MQVVQALQGALGGAEPFWLVVTNLGSDYAFIVLLTLYLWLLDPRGGRTLGVVFAVAILVDALLNLAVVAPRPFHLDASLATQAAIDTAGGSSFPSGHALVSAALWGTAALLLRRAWLWWTAGAVVFMVALSRLVLGLHYPTDVLAGLAVGALLAWAGSRVRLPRRDLVVPAVLVLAAAFLPLGDSTKDLVAGLGILAGFWAVRPQFAVPRAWTGRLVLALVGLTVVIGAYVAFSLIRSQLPPSNLLSALRYVVLVVAAVELVPRLLRRLTAEQESAPAGA